MVGEYSCPLMAEQWEVTLWSKFTDSHYHLQDCSPRLFDSFCMRLEILGLFCEGERLNFAAGHSLTSANGILPSPPLKRKKYILFALITRLTYTPSFHFKTAWKSLQHTAVIYDHSTFIVCLLGCHSKWEMRSQRGETGRKEYSDYSW